jgi:hypothetical protein
MSLQQLVPLIKLTNFLGQNGQGNKIGWLENP